MNVAANPSDVSSHKVGFSWLLTQVQHHRLHCCEDVFLLFGRIQVGNIPRVQNIVDILKE